MLCGIGWWGVSERKLWIIVLERRSHKNWKCHIYPMKLRVAVILRCRYNFFPLLLNGTLCNCVTMPHAYNFPLTLKIALLCWRVKKIICHFATEHRLIKQAHWTKAMRRFIVPGKKNITSSFRFYFFLLWWWWWWYDNMCEEESSAWGNIAFLIKYKGVLATFPLRVYSNEPFEVGAWFGMTGRFFPIVGVPLFGLQTKHAAGTYTTDLYFLPLNT